MLLLGSSQSHAEDPWSALKITQPKARVQAPGFSLDHLNGESGSLEDYTGKVVLLNFWATWCAPCRKEMPVLQQLWEKYRDQGFVVLAIAADRGNRKGIVKMLNEMGLDFPVLHDPEGEVRNRYEVSVLPMTYLIGRDGKISGRAFGEREWAAPESMALIKALLQQ